MTKVESEAEFCWSGTSQTENKYLLVSTKIILDHCSPDSLHLKNFSLDMHRTDTLIFYGVKQQYWYACHSTIHTIILLVVRLSFHHHSSRELTIFLSFLKKPQWKAPPIVTTGESRPKYLLSSESDKVSIVSYYIFWCTIVRVLLWNSVIDFNFMIWNLNMS